MTREAASLHEERREAAPPPKDIRMGDTTIREAVLTAAT